MNSDVRAYLDTHHIGVFSVLLPTNEIHGATVHLSYTFDPFTLYIQTSKESVKAEPLIAGTEVPCSVVLGVSEEEWKTLQIRGVARIISDPAVLEKIGEIHEMKNPGSAKRRGPHTIFIQVSPTWWRYSDLKQKPPVIICS